MGEAPRETRVAGKIREQFRGQMQAFSNQQLALSHGRYLGRNFLGFVKKLTSDDIALGSWLLDIPSHFYY